MDTEHVLYATDLTDQEWALLKPVLPPESPIGRPRLHSLRTILNAIFFELRTGGAWRFLPQERPPWQNGRRCITIFAAGGWMGRGNASTRCCSCRCAFG